MPEFINNISNQITEYWNKFSRTQKIQIIAVFAVSIIALIVLTLVLSRTDYTPYRNDVTPQEMTRIKSVLDEKGISYQINGDATAISIDSGKFQDATLALADAGMLPTDGMSFQDYMDNLSLTMSQSDKKMMAKVVFETQLASYISMISSVESANVSLVIPEENALYMEERQSSASVWLDLNGELSDDQVYGIASMMESSVENLSTDNIKIFDRKNTRLLFNGMASSGGIGNMNTYIEAERIQEAYYTDAIEMLLLNGSIYDDAVVSVNLKMDFNQVNSTSERHYLPDGSAESLPTRIYIQNQTGSNTEAGGIPGTDANDGTTDYLIDSGAGSESSLEITEKEYDVDTVTTITQKSVGDIIPSESSISITLNKFKYYYEEMLEQDDTLADTTWEKFQLDNGQSEVLDVDPSIIQSVANYANLDESNVVVIAYEVPRFIDKPVQENRIADYIPVMVIVLMIALLGYAVYKGTEPVEVTEVEPELSVEDMLATTKVSDELEAIEFDDKSEARRQIENFVEENPEAVAQLLRNWLNDDWE